MPPPLPAGWREVLSGETGQDYYRRLGEFLAAERARYTVFPPEDEVFTALELTPPAQVKALILGQDPYHDHGQAHGLAFSVRPGVKPPPSLRNIFLELRDDLGCPLPASGCLIPWAEQGVLLLNTVLTVRAHQAHSHRGKGWERFTDAVIRAVSAGQRPVAFVLWGAPAQKKRPLIDVDRHLLVESAHPSPLSARRGFLGSRPFSRTNRALEDWGRGAVDWCLEPGG